MHKKSFVTICFGFREKNAILTGLLGQNKVGGVIFKIFITRWLYIELGNNTNSSLSFYVSFWQDSTFFLQRKTHSDNFMSYKTSQIIGIFYMQIGAHKSA